MNQEKSILGKALFDAIAATLMVTILGYTSYLMLEPMAGFAATTATSQFIVNQQITAEVSFLVNAANVTLAAIGVLRVVTQKATPAFASIRTIA